MSVFFPSNLLFENLQSMIYMYTVCLGLICIFNPISVLADIEPDCVTILNDDAEIHSTCNDYNEEPDKYSRLINRPIVHIEFGEIVGQIETFNNEEVVVFSGIRYSKPPIGELRFKKPERLDENTIEVFGLQAKDKVACIQPKNFLIDDELRISEDCLHLNIWVPFLKESNEDLNLPVMIWIHGGSFHIGSGNQDEFNGIVLSSVGKVIVVTLNYRLGFFGFLNAGIEAALGNMGLYDQTAAVTWVNKNIKNFGGDPNQITLFGESAGGMSVALLTISPLTENLFNRAIIESGSPYSPLRPEPEAEVFKKSLMFSKALNCSAFDDKKFTESAMKCLRDMDYKIIDDYGKDEVMHSQILPNPMFGDELIPANIHILMKNPENINKKLQVLLGINRDEGFVFVFQQLRHLLESSGSKFLAKNDIFLELKRLLSGRSVDPTEITNYYFANMTSEWDSMTVSKTIFDLYGDLYINCPVYYLANRYKEILGYENTFTYMLTKASARQYMPICKNWSKVCHGDEIVLVFGVPLRNPQEFDSSDQELSMYFVRVWSEFARTGQVHWSNFSNPNNWFIELPPENVLNFHPEKTYACEDFWRELFQNKMDT